jgi:glycine/D-amino acid oxidase-like deaminating enzyme
MGSLILNNHEVVKAQNYVFALGPWLGKTFPGLLGPRMRNPIGRVCYFSTPHGDSRFEWPNMPSFNFPGVTGWPTLPFDSRGLRIRGGGGGGGGRSKVAVVAVEVQAPRRQPLRRSLEDRSDPDLSDRYVDPLTVERARNFLAERIPLMKDQPLNETRACHYEQSSSRNFIIDRHPDIPNAWIAGGGSAEAFKSGPVIGEYVARRVLNKDLEPHLARPSGFLRQTYEGIIAPARTARGKCEHARQR